MASGNHYSRQVHQLEALLNSRLKQISVLENEHQLLVDKEKVLQNAIHSMEGPLALVTESLGAGGAGGAAAGSVVAGNPETAVAALAAACDREFGSCESSVNESHHTEGSQSYASGDAGVVEQPNSPTTSAGSGVAVASGLAAASYKGGSALLQQIINREGKVQHVLQQLGCCDGVSYRQLYTTQLLLKAVSDPVRMAGYLNMPKTERLQYWSQAYCHMALLLGKYDSNVSLAAGNVRQQVDSLVDELFERVIVCAQLDAPSKHMSCFMFNVDTHEFEPYPDGWWKQVIEGMQLSAQDRAALKLVWDKIQVSTKRLAQEWEQVQQQLQQQQVQQLASNKRIERAFKELPSLLQTLTVAERARQQDKQAQRRQQQQQQQQQALAAQSLAGTHPGQPQLCLLNQQLNLAQAQLASLQQQQQQQQQSLQQQQPLQQLHDAWQHEVDQQQQLVFPQQPDMLVDQSMAEIAAELVHQPARQLAQQQQQPMVWTGASQYGPGAAAQAAIMGGGVGSTACILPEGPGMALGQQFVPAGAHYSSPAAGQGYGLQAQTTAGYPAAGYPPLAQTPTKGLQQQQQQQQPWETTPGRQSSGEANGDLSRGSGPADAASGSFAQPAGAQARASPQAVAGPAEAAGAAAGAPVADGGFSHLQDAEEVLLQDGTQERQRLEHALQVCTNKIKVLNFCLLLHVTNTLTKKQLAAMCVHSHPFVFDVHSMCEALDQTGWGC